MKRVLPDQGLSPLAAGRLRSEGWDAVHVSEFGMGDADDPEILAYAGLEGRCCIILDHDFHEHLALLQASAPSVVLVRIEGLKALAQAALIPAVWATCEQDIALGAAVSVDSRSVRVRRLPLR